MHFKVQTEKYLSDTLTPVSVYMKIRKKFTEVLLLESADYRGSENSLSFICFSPLAKFKVEDNKQEVILPGEKNSLEEIVDRGAVLSRLQNFFQELSLEQDNDLPNGFFGYCTYEAVKYFEDIELAAPPSKERQVPEICYAFYEFLIIFNHYKNEIHIIHNQSINSACSRTLEEIKDIIFHSEFSFSEFCTVEEESSNLTDQDTLRVIEKCKSHIARGDVFQIVVSRRFMQKYKGDDFNVYRTLRSINPSPYLFYFDYLDYRIFGSSPEAQLTVKDSVASIYPIAGTYPRRADRANDRELATELQSDPKENAEHIMLVDLARNDLNKHCKNVRVEVFKEVQFYSHVIHLV